MSTNLSTPNPFGPDPTGGYLESLRLQVVRALKSAGHTDEIAVEAAQQAVYEGQAALQSGEASNVADPVKWLLNKAKNAARRIIDKRKIRAAKSTRLRPGQFSGTVNEAPGKRLDTDVYKSKIRQALHLLPKREREAMELFLSGASYIEVADRMGVSLATACVYRARAIERLKFYFPPD